jgi:hypothetical protein
MVRGGKRLAGSASVPFLHTYSTANVRLQITYLNSVVMPDEESSDSSEEHGEDSASDVDDNDA